MSASVRKGRLHRTEDGRWALAVAWCWCVEAGLVPELDRQTAEALTTEAEVSGLGGLDEVRGVPVWAADAWALIHSEQDWSEPGRWVDVLQAVSAGVRGLARVVLLDSTGERKSGPPSWLTTAGVRALPGGVWEVTVGLGHHLEQAGEWPTRAEAERVARLLRPRFESQADGRGERAGTRKDPQVNARLVVRPKSRA